MGDEVPQGRTTSRQWTRLRKDSIGKGKEGNWGGSVEKKIFWSGNSFLAGRGSAPTAVREDECFLGKNLAEPGGEGSIIVPVRKYHSVWKGKKVLCEGGGKGKKGSQKKGD